MRRTKHRRRYHTGRIIMNRQRRHRKVRPEDHRRWPREDGRLANHDTYLGCSRAGCGLCHPEKFEPNRERIEGVRQCRDWWHAG